MRAFIAIEIPEELRTRLSAVRAELSHLLTAQQMASALRWSGTQNYHLTLRFLGETGEDQRACVEALLGRVTAHCPPFPLSLEGLGAFPNWRKMRVLWVGMTGDLPPLNTLQGRIESGAQACGFAVEPQGFHPHITLARTSREAPSGLISQAGALLAEQTKVARQLGQWEVSELVLMQSDLRPEGSVYTVLGRYQLGG